jgi:zinc/manganese transport system permease protein
MFDIFYLPLLAGLLISITHVPLGFRVIDKGIVFLDIAIAQIAVLGMVFLSFFHFHGNELILTVLNFLFVIFGSFILLITEKKFKKFKEAIIGAVFVVCASLILLLLSKDPHGSEQLHLYFSGQILWVNQHELTILGGLALTFLLLFFKNNQFLINEYFLFAITITISVKIIGIYLVFASLILPPISTLLVKRYKFQLAFLVAFISYTLGLSLSFWSDLPTSPLIIVTMGVISFILIILNINKNTIQD